MNNKTKCSKALCVILITFLVLASLAFGNKEEDEEYRYWLQREAAASKIAHASYVADPFTVTDSFNRAVDGSSIKKSTSSPSVHSGSNENDGDEV